MLKGLWLPPSSSGRGHSSGKKSKGCAHVVPLGLKVGSCGQDMVGVWGGGRQL
jgi:hypothetical protein